VELWVVLGSVRSNHVISVTHPGRRFLFPHQESIGEEEFMFRLSILTLVLWEDSGLAEHKGSLLSFLAD
jgi:hypothetical protein